jgi:hypothetical protein
MAERIAAFIPTARHRASPMPTLSSTITMARRNTFQLSALGHQRSVFSES